LIAYGFKKSKLKTYLITHSSLITQSIDKQYQDQPINSHAVSSFESFIVASYHIIY